jgi:hypothetical protein
MNKQEIIKKIKNREVAIFNDHRASLIKCVNLIYYKPKKVGGAFSYY